MELIKKAKKPSNNDVLTLATEIGDFTYMSLNMRYVRNYDVQEVVRESIPVLKAVSDKIKTDLDKQFSKNWKKSDPKVKAILDEDSGITLRAVNLTKDQLRSFQPNWDAMYVFDFISNIIEEPKPEKKK